MRTLSTLLASFFLALVMFSSKAEAYGYCYLGSCQMQYYNPPFANVNPYYGGFGAYGNISLGGGGYMGWGSGGAQYGYTGSSLGVLGAGLIRGLLETPLSWFSSNDDEDFDDDDDLDDLSDNSGFDDNDISSGKSRFDDDDSSNDSGNGRALNRSKKALPLNETISNAGYSYTHREDDRKAQKGNTQKKGSSKKSHPTTQENCNDSKNYGVGGCNHGILYGGSDEKNQQTEGDICHDDSCLDNNLPTEVVTEKKPKASEQTLKPSNEDHGDNTCHPIFSDAPKETPLGLCIGQQQARLPQESLRRCDQRQLEENQCVPQYGEVAASAFQEVTQCLDFDDSDKKDFFGIIMHESRFHMNAVYGDSVGIGQMIRTTAQDVIQHSEQAITNCSSLVPKSIEGDPILSKIKSVAKPNRRHLPQYTCEMIGGKGKDNEAILRKTLLLSAVYFKKRLPIQHKPQSGKLGQECRKKLRENKEVARKALIGSYNAGPLGGLKFACGISGNSPSQNRALEYYNKVTSELNNVKNKNTCKEVGFLK